MLLPSLLLFCCHQCCCHRCCCHQCCCYHGCPKSGYTGRKCIIKEIVWILQVHAIYRYHHHSYWNVHFSHAKLGLDKCPISSPSHIFLFIAHSHQTIHSLQISLLLPLPFTPSTSIFIQTDIQSYIQDAHTISICHILNTSAKLWIQIPTEPSILQWHSAHPSQDHNALSILSCKVFHPSVKQKIYRACVQTWKSIDWLEV